MRLLALFAKLGGLSAVPVIGPVLGLIGSLFGLVCAFLRWLLKDIEDAFKEPQRLAVRIVCLVAVLFVGLWHGIAWDKHKVEAARAEVAQMKKDWRERDEADSRRASTARAAREQAEREALEAAEREAREAAAAAPAPAPGVVRAKRKPAPAPKPQPGLFGGLPALFGVGK